MNLYTGRCHWKSVASAEGGVIFMAKKIPDISHHHPVRDWGQVKNNAGDRLYRPYH